MGYNNEDAPILVFDIETRTALGAEEFLPEPKVPSNFTNPETIARFKKDDRAEKLSKAPTHIDLLSICAIGIQLLHPEGEEYAKPQIILARDEDEEVNLLQLFWDTVRRYKGLTFCGYNILGFDLLAVLRRSMYQRVHHPSVEIHKYRHPHILDLELVLSYDGLLKWERLEFFTRRFGIQRPTDDLRSEDVPAAAERGEWERIARHCLADIVVTTELYRRCREAGIV